MTKSVFVAIGGQVVLSIFLRIVIEPFVNRSEQHLPYITIAGFSVDNVPMTHSARISHESPLP